MNLESIKYAIETGRNVYWSNTLYRVIKSKNNNYDIVCSLNGYTIGLTWQDGITLNGKESDFFTQ